MKKLAKSRVYVHSKQNEMVVIFEHKTFFPPFKKIISFDFAAHHFHVIIIVVADAAAMKVVKMQIVSSGGRIYSNFGFLNSVFQIQPESNVKFEKCN